MLEKVSFFINIPKILSPDLYFCREILLFHYLSAIFVVGM